jgi:hypothetical protein
VSGIAVASGAIVPKWIAEESIASGAIVSEFPVLPMARRLV